MMRILLGFFLVGLVGCQSSPSQPGVDADVDQLLALIKERLDVMPNVASAKIYLGLPTEDTKREEALLQAIELDAKANGLEPAFARDFFKAQFKASKTYQDPLRPKLPRPEPSDEGMKAAELKLTDARMKINQCNEKLLATLSKLKWSQNEQKIRTLVAIRAPIVFMETPLDVWQQATEPIR